MLRTLLYFLALFCLATSSNWAKLNHMPVDVLGFYRLGFAALFLGIWIFTVKRIKLPALDRQMIWVVVSGVFFFMHLWTFKYAAKNTTISNGMIIFSSNPVWSSLGAVIFFREKLSVRLICSYILALIGVYLLVAPDLQLNSQMNKGDIASLLSAILFAGYMLSGKKARRHFDNELYAFGQYLICAVCFAICIGFTEHPLAGYDTVSWVAVAGLVLMPTFFGHFTFTYLVHFMDLSTMTCGKLIEPVIASLIAVFLFSEKLSAQAPFAFILTSAAVLLLFVPQLYKQLIVYFELRE
jgi:drug/metabolite transporter (DMT)-like permease